MKKRMIMSLTIGTMIFSMAACGSSTGATSGKAQADENGNYVVNGGFEESDFTGWTVTNVDDVTEELDIYTRETDCYEGVQSLHFYSADSDVNFTAEQTISGLEAGTYKLSGFVQGEHGWGCRFRSCFLCDRRRRDISGKRSADRICGMERGCGGWN